jgi:hypothetical protein
MGSQLKHWQEEALATDAKERQVRRELEKIEPTDRSLKLRVD